MWHIKIFLIIILVLIFIISIVPRKYKVKDGGTIVYKLLIYEIDKVHTRRAKEEILLGYRVYIFGQKLFDNTYTVANCPYHDTH